MSHPCNITAGIGEPVELSVGTRGDPPIMYQWYRNDVLIKDQTMPKLFVSDFHFF